MADEQPTVEVPQEAAPVAEPAAEPAKVEETPAEVAAPAAESTEGPKAAETPQAAEEPAKEALPVEEGHLEYKASGFPKNLVYSKKFFWFGAEPVEAKKLSAYQKAEKAVETAHHVVSWAAETGKGLLFYSERSDKAPQGVIQLSEASEPATEGPNKFHFTTKGHKHTFKAPNAADRDNWVSQIKIKITEAKELAGNIIETETYKKTLEGLKPTPAPKKEDKPAEVAAAPVPDAADAAAAAPAEETPAAPAPEESKKDLKAEATKRRSTSRKRASIFGNIFSGNKKEVEDKKVDAPAAEPEAAEATTSTEPAAEVAEPVAAPEAAEPAETPAPAPEVKAEEAKTEAKPTPVKRNSIFSGFNLGKKKAAAPAEPEAAKSTPAKDEPAAAEPAPVVAETAPVIPAVEHVEPLSADVSTPANVPVETVDITPATNGDKKEVKSEKRKASLPFNFGRKDKATSDEETEKPKTSPFSRLRATIRGNKAKGADKPADEKAEPEPEAEGESSQAAEAAPTEAAPATAPVEDVPAEQPIVTSTPTVAATA